MVPPAKRRQLMFVRAATLAGVVVVEGFDMVKVAFGGGHSAAQENALLMNGDDLVSHTTSIITDSAALASHLA